MADPQIRCEKCKQGTMLTARVPRMSSGLRMVGFTLWVPALALLILSAGCGILMTGAGGSAMVDSHERLRTESANRLRDIPELPVGEVEEFGRTGAISPSALEALTPGARARVDSELSTYAAGSAGAALGGTAAAGAAGIGVFAVYAVCVPLFIVGLLLTRRKNVWKCPTCGYLFERA